MSNISPNDLHEGFHAAITWEVPCGGKLHKFNFLVIFKDLKLVQMDRDGENVKIWKAPTGIAKFWKSTPSNAEKFEFKFDNLKLEVNVASLDDGYLYALDINEKSLKMYKEDYYKKFNTWIFKVDEKDWRVVLDKQALEVYINGEKCNEAKMSFKKNGGASAHFLIGLEKLRIEVQGEKSTGLTYDLFVNGEKKPADINLHEPVYRFHDVVKNNLFKSGIV